MERQPLDPFIRRWGLVLEGPVLETPSGRVAFARRGGEGVVLKVPDPGSEEATSWAALLHFGGEGAVRVLDRAGGATLLERAVPGRPLTELVLAGRDDEATAVLCDVVAALHRPGPPGTGFPRIEDWGRGFERYRETGDTTVPAAMVDRARGLFAELAASQGRRRLLHGDLHHDNVLQDARRGWLALDPKGVVGERAYEIGAALRNPTADPALFAVPAIVDRRVRIASERLALDARRVLGWAFAQAALSAVWAVEDGADPARGLATAGAVLPLL